MMLLKCIKPIKDIIWKKKWTFCVILLFLLFYYLLFMNKALVQVELHVDSNEIFKIYWAGENKPFSEKGPNGFVSVPEGNLMRCT